MDKGGKGERPEKTLTWIVFSIASPLISKLRAYSPPMVGSKARVYSPFEKEGMVEANPVKFMAKEEEEEEEEKYYSDKTSSKIRDKLQKMVHERKRKNHPREMQTQDRSPGQGFQNHQELKKKS